MRECWRGKEGRTGRCGKERACEVRRGRKQEKVEGAKARKSEKLKARRGEGMQMKAKGNRERETKTTKPTNHDMTWLLFSWEKWKRRRDAHRHMAIIIRIRKWKCRHVKNAYYHSHEEWDRKDACMWEGHHRPPAPSCEAIRSQPKMEK